MNRYSGTPTTADHAAGSSAGVAASEVLEEQRLQVKAKQNLSPVQQHQWKEYEGDALTPEQKKAYDSMNAQSGVGSAAGIAASEVLEEQRLRARGPCGDPAFADGSQDPAFTDGSSDPAFSHGCSPAPAPAHNKNHKKEDTGSPAGSPVSVHMNYSKVDLHHVTNATTKALMHALPNARNQTGGSQGYPLVLP